MSGTIWKYQLEHAHQSIDMPAGSELLRVGSQSNQICVWAKVDPNRPLEKREFWVVGTGHDVPDHVVYIGTALIFGERLVMHVFEEVA